MPTREVLSPAQRASLLTIPADFSERELARYYTLTEEDLAVIQPPRISPSASWRATTR